MLHQMVDAKEAKINHTGNATKNSQHVCEVEHGDAADPHQRNQNGQQAERACCKAPLRNEHAQVLRVRHSPNGDEAQLRERDHEIHERSAASTKVDAHVAEAIVPPQHLPALDDLEHANDLHTEGEDQKTWAKDEPTLPDTHWEDQKRRTKETLGDDARSRHVGGSPCDVAGHVRAGGSFRQPFLPQVLLDPRNKTHHRGKRGGHVGRLITLNRIQHVLRSRHVRHVRHGNCGHERRKHKQI
mmetsp:Transcript_8321/g.23126  ORF Transcript_8321/g.23126 Transcript_8321/m.23126 type:complete len:242 (+) Transcript_8321:857-1582(+)